MEDDESGGGAHWWQERIRSPEFIQMIHGVARSIIRDAPAGYDCRDDAVNDACQEGLTHLWDTPPPEDVRDYDAWACTVAKRKMLSFLRIERRQTRNRQPDRPPCDDDDQENADPFYNRESESNPTLVACELREVLQQAFETAVAAAEEQGKNPRLAWRSVEAKLLGLSVAELALAMHVTEHDIKNLRNKVIQPAYLKQLADVLAERKHRGPKRGKKGKSGPRRKSARGKDDDSGEDNLAAAAFAAASTVHITSAATGAERELLAA